jgi:DnaD/phage-associated family protein
MFSKGITNSAKFLKMPLESQALYFHLAQNADDDGIAEGFTIMRLVGASEDSLKILSAKRYIEVLNDDLVIFVIDWLEHNSLRADRKKDSLYQNLLLEKIPEIQLLQSKERKDRVKKNDPMTDNGQPMVSNGTSQCQSMVGRGEGRLGKGRLGNDNSSESSSNPFNFYSKNFGPITQFMSEEIGTFIDDGIDEEVIIKCMGISLETGANNWKYAKGILNRLLSANIKTLDQFESKEKEFNNNNKNVNGRKNNGRRWEDVEVGEQYLNPNTNMLMTKTAPIPRNN